MGGRRTPVDLSAPRGDIALPKGALLEGALLEGALLDRALLEGALPDQALADGGDREDDARPGG